MQKIIKQYVENYKKYGDSPKTLFWTKGRQELRFEKLTSYIYTDNFSLLDFGCGLAHLKDFLDKKYTNYSYCGVDIVKEFIEIGNKKHPKANIYLINSFKDIDSNYDYIVASGVFNLIYCDDKNKHQQIVFEIVEYLFSKTNKALLIDFMTDKVDFIQEDNYHQNIPQLYNFITEKLSKRFIIDQSYMPYEFSCIIYKDDTIVRPDNVFRNI